MKKLFIASAIAMMCLSANAFAEEFSASVAVKVVSFTRILSFIEVSVVAGVFPLAQMSFSNRLVSG